MQGIVKNTGGSFGGNLDSVPLLDVFQLLFGGKKTGMLEIISGETKKRVYLKSGMIAAAESSEDKDLLGKILIKRGRLSKPELAKALRLHRKSGKILGKVLIEMNLFSDAEVNAALKSQVEEIIYGMFGLESGEFVFHEGKGAVKPELDAPLNPMNVIMEATRRLDEWSEIEDKLPPLNAIIVGNIEDFVGEEIRISKEEFQILLLIDGKKPFRKVLSESIYDRFITAKTIHRFISMGLLKCEKMEKELPVSGIDRNTILQDLVKLHKDVYEVVSSLYVELMNEAGRNILSSIYKQCKTEYTVLDRFSNKANRGIEYESICESAKSLPEDAILHKLGVSLYALSESYLLSIKDYLGVIWFERAISRLRKRILGYYENRKQQLAEFGLDEEVFKLLHLS